MLVDIDNKTDDNSMDVDTEFDASDDDVLAPKVNTAAPAKKKTASETYTKVTHVSLLQVMVTDTRGLYQLSQLEHILKRPDSYIGSVETITQAMWTYDADTKRMIHRDVRYVPGFFKIVDEILVNAADNKVSRCQAAMLV